MPNRTFRIIPKMCLLSHLLIETLAHAPLNEEHIVKGPYSSSLEKHCGMSSILLIPSTCT